MGTIPDRPEPADLWSREQLLAWMDGSTRTVIAGSSVGAVRRIVLYAIVGVCLIGAGWLGIIGVVALLFLATTDILR